MIIGYIGPRGSGKTLGMTARLQRRKKQGYKIITNYGPECGDEEIDAEALSEMGEDLQNVAMGIDEIHVLLDSRRSASTRNLLISYFILQTRKRNVVLFYTSQALHQVEMRLRDQTDYFVFARRVGEHLFYYQIFDGLTWRRVGRFVLDGRNYYGSYDTTRTITDFQKKTKSTVSGVRKIEKKPKAPVQESAAERRERVKRLQEEADEEALEEMRRLQEDKVKRALEELRNKELKEVAAAAGATAAVGGGATGVPPVARPGDSRESPEIEGEDPGVFDPETAF